MYFTGIDISKGKLDWCVIDQERNTLISKQSGNTTKAVERFISVLTKKLRCNLDELVICCENTGIYNEPLKAVCVELGVSLWVENAHKIKKASYDLRGKSDEMDALRIADYCLRYFDRFVRYEAPSEAAFTLRELKEIREELVDEKNRFMNMLREAKSHCPKKYRLQKERFQPIIKSVTNQLSKVEKQIQDVIDSEESIKKNIDLLCTIPGVGLQNALMFIIITDNFKRFESAKHLACYAGVVPFPNQSGNMAKRDRVSKHANRKLKKLLHMAAITMKRCDPEMNAYYQRKVAQGKHHMCIINAIRNKIVHRMWAVVKRQQPYLKNEPILV